MKSSSNTLIYVTFLLLFFCSSCSENQSPSEQSRKAQLPKGFVTTEDLGPALGVRELVDREKTTSEIIVEGFIGGRKKPFTQNKAIFIVGDDSLETCDEIPGDSCPTPWDVCCEDRKKIASSILSVQVKDGSGSILDGTLEGVSGMRAGSKIKIKGNFEKNSGPQSMLLNAYQIQMLAD